MQLIYWISSLLLVYFLISSIRWSRKYHIRPISLWPKANRYAHGIWNVDQQKHWIHIHRIRRGALKFVTFTFHYVALLLTSLQVRLSPIYFTLSIQIVILHLRCIYISHNNILKVAMVFPDCNCHEKRHHLYIALPFVSVEKCSRPWRGSSSVTGVGS